MNQHPLSKAFPLPTQSEFDALRDDIRDHGQRHAIVVYQDMILDGWTRFRACNELGIDPIIEEYGGNDPAGYVLSCNLHRRHLSASQRAGAIVACNEWRSGAGRPKKESGNVAQLTPTSAQMAETAQVSERTIKDAKTAHSAGFESDIRDGKTTVSEAANLARKAPEVAARVVAKEITPAEGKAQLQAKVKRELPQFGPSESEKFAELQADKARLEAALADKNAEIIALELAGVDEGARNEAKDKMQGYIDAIDNAERMRAAAEALLSEANYKAGELLRTNNAQDAQIKRLKARIAELERCAK